MSSVDIAELIEPSNVTGLPKTSWVVLFLFHALKNSSDVASIVNGRSLLLSIFALRMNESRTNVLYSEKIIGELPALSVSFLGLLELPFIAGD